jgi:hypothetical protein
MVVPQVALKLALDATAQLSAVSDVPPVSATPLPPELRARMQAGELFETSATALASTVRVLPLRSTRERTSGTVVVMPTCTAWLPSPVGELIRAYVTSALEIPLSAAMLVAAAWADLVKLVLPYTSAAP